MRTVPICCLWLSVLVVCCLVDVDTTRAPPLTPSRFQLLTAGPSAWAGSVTLACPSGWMLKSLFLSSGFYGWLASSDINQGGLRVSTEVRITLRNKLERVYFLF